MILSTLSSVHKQNGEREMKTNSPSNQGLHEACHLKEIYCAFSVGVRGDDWRHEEWCRPSLKLPQIVTWNQQMLSWHTDLFNVFNSSRSSFKYLILSCPFLLQWFNVTWLVPPAVYLYVPTANICIMERHMNLRHSVKNICWTGWKPGLWQSCS